MKSVLVVLVLSLVATLASCGGAVSTSTSTPPVVQTPPQPPATTPPPATPAKHYLLVDLVPIPGANNSQANAVYHGHAAGYSLLSDGTTRVAFWHDGAADDLGPGYATSINSTDQIVGYTTQSDGTLHASLWDHGVVTDLGLLAGFDSSLASGINDSGEIVGVSFSSQNPSNQVGFRWTSATGMQAIDGSANALGINAKGDIAGMTQNLRAAIFSTTGTIALGTLGDFSLAGAVNNKGHAAGYSPLVSGGPTHAFFYDGTIHDLGAFGGGDSSSATSMNDDDLIVGNNVGSFGVKFRTLGVARVVGNGTPFIWSASTGLVDLNTLIDPGFVMSTAGGIDKDGEIVGAGGINGVVHGFLLTPD